MARKNRVGVMISEFGLHDSTGTVIDDTLARRSQCVLSVGQLSDAERGQMRAKGIPLRGVRPDRGAARRRFPTTVHQPLTEMAAAATELAFALGHGEDPPQIGVEIATKLTVRESTAPPTD